MSLLPLLVLLCRTSSIHGIPLQHLKTTHEDSKLSGSSCPPAEAIAPCYCYTDYRNQETGQWVSKLQIECDGLTDVKDIERVFSVDFPVINLDSIVLMANYPTVYENSSPVNIPKNMFQDKTAKEITIAIKINKVHHKAFENTAVQLETLTITGKVGPDSEATRNPITVFPLKMLEDLPSLKAFTLLFTMISDDTFKLDGDSQNFSDLILPNIGECSRWLSCPYYILIKIFSEKLDFSAGKLTRVPKFCDAPKLKEVLFTYNPLASIEAKAFHHLPSLESVNLSGYNMATSMDTLDKDALAFSSTHLAKLSMDNLENLAQMAPGFISNIQPNTVLDFSDDNISVLTEEAFREMFEVVASGPWGGPGRVMLGGNPLTCDCSISWVTSDPRLLAIVDWQGISDHQRPRCRDGSLLADIDLSKACKFA